MNHPSRLCLGLASLLCAGAAAPTGETEPSAQQIIPIRHHEAGLAVSAEGLTLADCYRLALAQSEAVAIRNEMLNATEGQFLQALSTALPSVDYQIAEKRQDGSGASAFSLKRIPEQKFALSQPLFSGFKEFAAMAGSRAQRRQRAHETARAEHLLLIDVANAFHLLLQQQGDIRALDATRKALEDRLGELHRREELGRSRQSEVASAEARLRRVEADLESARSSEMTARQLMEFLTGQSPLGLLNDDQPDPLALPAEGEYLAKAHARPDVKSAEEAWNVARKAVWVAQAGFWPTVSLDANYYTKRAGVSEDITWDATLDVSIPIFHGGNNLGATKTARSEARQAKLTFELTKRQAELEIRSAYATLQGSIARYLALVRALDAAEENYRLQVEDYGRNLVNNLDVLQALQDVQDARRDVIAAQHTAKRDHWKLRVATGETL
ncbi:MAG: TolC family protein [Candidatus Omnitrophica bacterium]|nr:TolC family protein [Candidatus Omnitrophota bacterium]